MKLTVIVKDQNGDNVFELDGGNALLPLNGTERASIIAALLAGIGALNDVMMPTGVSSTEGVQSRYSPTTELDPCGQKSCDIVPLKGRPVLGSNVLRLR